MGKMNMLAFCVGLVVFVGVLHFSTADNNELSGSNVCSRQRYKTEYYNVNVSYSCWDRTVVGMGNCTHHTSRAYLYHDRYSGRTTCYMSTFSTCYRVQRRCETRWVTEKFCCRGYEENGNRCEASIQCGSNNGGCDHTCQVGTGGDHVCGCYPGYKLTNRTTCIDENECAVNNGGCNQNCKNLNNGFYCSCNNGYRLKTPTECEEIDECATGNGGCEHLCHNTAGAFYCECEPGYIREKGFMCQQIITPTSPTGNTTRGFIEPLLPHSTEAPQEGLPDRNTAERHEGGDDAGKLAGIVIGALAGVAILIAALVLAVLLVRRYGCGCCWWCCAAAARRRDNEPPPAYTAENHLYNDVHNVIVTEKKGALMPPGADELPKKTALMPSGYEGIVRPKTIENDYQGILPGKKAIENIAYDNNAYDACQDNIYDNVDGNAGTKQPIDEEEAVYSNVNVHPTAPPTGDSEALENEITRARSKLRSVSQE